MCSWQNSLADNTDWRRNNGYTPSSNTGPSADHTTGTYAGYYVYFEASYVSTGSLAYLDSPYYSAYQYCYLTFAYNMYGSDIGSLEVTMITSSGYQSLFSLSGNDLVLMFSTYIQLCNTNRHSTYSISH